MAVKAVWANRLDLPVFDDPFADSPASGVPIEIAGGEIGLNRRMVEMVEKEGRLAEADINCSIKDDPSTTCWACPLYVGGDDRNPLSVLCRLGRAQEKLITRLVALRVSHDS